MSFKAVFAAQPRWLMIAEMLCVILVIGWVDYLTAWELSLFTFYGIPIFIAAWQAGRRVGFALAILSGIVWFLANLHSHPYSTHDHYVWAAINRLLYFGFAAVGGAAMRHLREECRAHIEAIMLARSLEQEVVRAGEREQIRIGQDLHDGICQNLAVIDCATACLKQDLEEVAPPHAAAAAQIQKYLQDTIAETRNLAHGIVPVQVENGGIESALNDLTTRMNFGREVAVSFESRGEVKLDDPVIAVHLYRIAQEAVSNAARHSTATNIAIRLHGEDSTLRLVICDDGGGLPPRAGQQEGLGLKTMRYRAESIGAKLAIRSEPSRGTTVECVLGVNGDEPVLSGGTWPNRHPR